MKCPYCNEDETKVIDSRPVDDNCSIRRRRQCEKCGRRFTTYEKLETSPLNGTRAKRKKSKSQGPPGIVEERA